MTGVQTCALPISQTNKSKILRVPQNDMDMATGLARKKNMNVTVTNLSKTKRKKA